MGSYVRFAPTYYAILIVQARRSGMAAGEYKHAVFKIAGIVVESIGFTVFLKFRGRPIDLLSS